MPRNRQIFNGRSIREWSGGEISFRKPRLDLRKLVASRWNQGMITSIDSADIPIEALQFARNAKILFDKIGRRDGTEFFGPTPLDFGEVLKMAFLKRPDGTGHTYRFTKNSIYDLQNDAWNLITQLVPLVGTEKDRYNVSTILDIFAFTNNGANNVQWINTATDESDDLIENLGADLPSSKFRYCTSFYDRLVLAALREENEIMLAWTGQYGSQNTTKKGLEDLDPSVNETSGFGPLIDSPDDTADFITGIFGFSNIMVTLRENSIWHSTKQASAQNPFNSYRAVPGVGCNMPFSAKITKYGLTWLDMNSRTVYAYSPGSLPQPIGRPIERSLVSNISDPELVFGAYDSVEDVYSVCIQHPTSNFTSVWSYYFKEQGWTFNEYPLMTSFDVIELLTGGLTIDELVGTIDDLVGTIDELTLESEAKRERVFGVANGFLAIPDPDSGTDFGGQIFRTDLCSASFMLPGDDIQVAKIVFEYNMRVPGNLEIWYAPDGGVDNPNFLNPGSYVLGDIFEPTVLNKPQIITFRRVVHSRRFAFAIRASSGQFEALGYELWVQGAGDISMVRQVPLVGD